MIFRHRLTVVVVLVAVTLAVYWPVGRHPFTSLDDNLYVTANRRVQAGLTADGVAWAVTTFHAFNWHPLTWFSHMIDTEMFGPSAGGAHLENVLFHGVNAVLLFLLLFRMTGAPWRSAIVAALFAAHPLHVESVAWIAERKDVLSTFFGLLAVYAYLRYAARPGLPRLTAVCALHAASLASKPTLVTLPVLLLLLDYWPLGRIVIPGGPGAAVPGRFSAAPIAALVREKVPLMLLSAASGAIALIAQRQGGSVAGLELYPLAVRAGNAAVAYIAYAAKAAWPASLAVFYPHPGTSLSPWTAAGASLLLAAATVLVLLQARPRPFLAVGWLFYLCSLLPMIGLVQVGGQAMADRYTYVPLTGLFLAAVWGLSELAEAARFPRKAAAAAAAAAIFALAAAARIQVGYWRGDIPLFDRAVRVTDGNWLAHDSLGAALAREGRLAEAVPHFVEALRIRPNYAMARYNLGVTLEQTGAVADALANYREAIRIRPEFAEAHTNLGAALHRQGKLDEAVAAYRQALRCDGEDALTHSNLGLALAAQGRLAEAAAELEEAVRLRPERAEFAGYLQAVAAKRGMR